MTNLKTYLYLGVCLTLGISAYTLQSYAKVAVIPLDGGFTVMTMADKLEPGQAYFNDFSTTADGRRVDQFVAYRDPFVVTHTRGKSDHASTGGINCTAPEQTRNQTRSRPYDHMYQCLPGGDAALGHMMAFAMDTSGYGFAGSLPNQVFEDVTEVAVDISTTSAGSRNFIEIKVIPADNVFVNAMPCIPGLPCNSGWDYDDINGVGAGTDSQEGTGLKIATPVQPDGYRFDVFNYFQLDNGDTQYRPCHPTNHCFSVRTHTDNGGIRERYQHIFRDNGNGTLAFGIEGANGQFHWVEAPGSFPSGPVRIVIAFHNYTGTKSGNGPGFDGNVSPSEGGFTWHWDELSVMASSSRAATEYYGGVSAEHIVTPVDCISFSQGQRQSSHGSDVLPRFHCAGDGDLDL